MVHSLWSMAEQPHVLFLNRVYPPTGGATGALLAEMAGALQARGYDVTVVTGPTENGRASSPSDVRVERVGDTPFTDGSHWQRMQTYVARHAGLIRGTLRVPSPDVIVTKTDPPMLKILGPLLARVTGAQLVHWAQDLYPEVAEAAGVLSENGISAGGLRCASTVALQNHDHIVAVGRCMRERIIERGVAPETVSVIPNWTPSAVASIPHEENAFREEHDLEDRFVVMYSGNLGLAHSFTPILDAAAQLQRTDPAVCILFVGDGPRKSALQGEVAERELDNVRFLPFQPWDRLAESLSAADLHLVTMNPDMEGLVVPSKIYGALRAGRPVLFLGPDGSEAARLVRENDCGTVRPEASGRDVAGAIRRWKAHPDERTTAGRRAMAAVRHGKEQAVDAFDRILGDVLDRPPARETAVPNAVEAT